MITTHSDDSVLYVTLNRPHRFNMLTCDVMRELHSVFTGPAHDHAVVVISGAGRAFSAGGDLRKLGGELSEFREISEAVFTQMRTSSAAVIAALHGHVIGAGLLLATACDLRIAAPTTAFSLPELSVGVNIDWPHSIERLRSELGASIMRGMLLTGEKLSATQAHQHGFVHSVVDDLSEAVTAHSRKIAAYSEGLVAATKQSVYADPPS